MSKLFDRINDGITAFVERSSLWLRGIALAHNDDENEGEELLKLLPLINISKVEQIVTTLDGYKAIRLEINNLYTHIMYLVEYARCISEKRLPSEDYSTVPSAQTITLKDLFVSDDGFELDVRNSILEFKDQCKMLVKLYEQLDDSSDRVSVTVGLMAKMLIRASINTARVLAEL